MAVRRNLGRLLVVLLCAAGWAALGAEPAVAHTRLVASSPAQGAQLDATPPEAVLRFDDPVSAVLSSVTVTGPAGGRALSLVQGRSSRELSASLPPLTPGSYRLMWRVPGSDGHPVTGAIGFAVTGSAIPAAAVGPPAPRAIDSQAGERGASWASPVYGVARWGALVCFALLLGGAFFAVALAPRAARVGRLVVFAGAGLTVTTLGALATFGPSVADVPLARAVDPEVLSATATSRTGMLLLARLALLAATAVALALLRRRPSPPVVLLWGLTAAATWSLGGHAGAEPLSAALDATHLVAAAVWLGGLVALLVTARHEAGLGRAFSPVAVRCVLVLVVTGSLQAVLRLGSVEALTELVYGRLLLLKISLVVLTLCVAALVRHRLTQAAQRPHHRGLAVEIALGMGVVGVTAALVVSSPVAVPSHETEPAAVPVAATGPVAVPTPQPDEGWATASVPFDTGGETGRGTMEVALLPRVGRTSLHVTVLDWDGRPVRSLLSAALRPASGGQPTVVRLATVGVGHFVGTDTELPHAGTWQLGLALVLADGSRTTAVARLTVP